MSDEYELDGRTIYRKAFVYERPGGRPTTVPRVALFHLCDVIEDADGVMTMLNTESREIQKLRAENERLRRDLAAQVENDEQLAKENVKVRWLLNQILTHLPSNRDWLDPDVEREARDTLADTPTPQRTEEPDS